MFGSKPATAGIHSGSKTGKSGDSMAKWTQPNRDMEDDAESFTPSQSSSRQLARRSRDRSVRIGRTRVGKGIFARRRYLADMVIGEIEGDVIDDPSYCSDYCMDIGDGQMLEPHAPFRYVNHSCEPNCEFDCFDFVPKGTTTPVRHTYLIALREIKPQEELTISYNWSANAAIVCRCGAPSCLGWIVDPEQLGDVPHARNVAALESLPAGPGGTQSDQTVNQGRSEDITVQPASLDELRNRIWDHLYQSSKSQPMSAVAEELDVPIEQLQLAADSPWFEVQEGMIGVAYTP